MARKATDDCMFCELGECPTHSPKPTIRRLRNPVVPKVRPVKEVELPEPSRAASALQARATAEADSQAVFKEAIRALAPLLADEELVRYGVLLEDLGPLWIRVNAWKRQDAPAPASSVDV